MQMIFSHDIVFDQMSFTASSLQGDDDDVDDPIVIKFKMSVLSSVVSISRV